MDELEKLMEKIEELEIDIENLNEGLLEIIEKVNLHTDQIKEIKKCL